jgi:hypothetical protein
MQAAMSQNQADRRLNDGGDSVLNNISPHPNSQPTSCAK